MARIALTRFVDATDLWLAQCRAAEELELAGVWAGDSPAYDGFVGAALAAAATERIAVGVAAALPVRSPLQTANAAAELARAGRSAPLVLAAGNALTVGLMHGETYESPVERMRDFHACVHGILRGPAGEWVEIETEHAVARGPGLGLDAAAAPLLLGATNPRMVALAGEVSDGLMVHLLTPRSAIAARVDAARSSAGRELSSAAGVLVSVDADEAAALARARAELAAALIVPMFRARVSEAAGDEVRDAATSLVEAGDLTGAAALLPEDCVRELILVTTPALLHAELEAVEVDTVLPVPVGAFLSLAQGALGHPDDPAASRDWLARAMFAERI